ncbi:hypothetical protein ACFYRY_00780 [Streptomyces sp. NPDC005263]|uniref:hypothetical protein n=1 Tax=Streptomyces sp. NPDC005263 TaxID=3364711 RepID=UPI0036BF0189
MAQEPGVSKRARVNQVVAGLVDAGSEDTVTLTGFVTPSARKGHVRLFTGLNDMSRSIEIAESDIVASVELPKSGLGAVALYVKRDAALHHHVVETAESCADRRSSAGGFRTVRRGGLRMRVRPQTNDVCTCEYFCDGTRCVPCTSQCLAQ